MSDFYTDQNGNLIFTSDFLLKKGSCCKNTCLHCPYGFTLKKYGLQIKKINIELSEIYLKGYLAGTIKNKIHVILKNEFKNQGLEEFIQNEIIK